jgi:flavin reductase (DIM6/NTAB) family NADH-FMN oxidoreductase RutF
MKKVKIDNRPFGPFPVVLVGAAVNGKPNYVTIGACGVVSLEPVLFISLRSSHYTTVGVKENGYFSINIPPAGLVRETDYCGMVSGKTADKSTVFTAFYDEKGKAPMISECSMNFLCKVIRRVPVSDFEMFFGEIVAAYVNEECLTDGKPDPKKIDPLLLMGPTYLDLGHAVGEVFKAGVAYKKSR